MPMNAVDVAEALQETVDASRGPLLAIGEEMAARRAGPENWSKKEILGHLIDSASNNHQRFVRLQSDELLVMPSYEQNHWVRAQNYGGREWQRSRGAVVRVQPASGARDSSHGPRGCRAHLEGAGLRIQSRISDRGLRTPPAPSSGADFGRLSGCLISTARSTHSAR